VVPVEQVSAVRPLGRIRSAREEGWRWLRSARVLEPTGARAHYSDAKVANRNARVWHAATENGPRSMDESQTLAAYV
jgi:hypothetical protein